MEYKMVDYLGLINVEPKLTKKEIDEITELSKKLAKDNAFIASITVKNE